MVKIYQFLNISFIKWQIRYSSASFRQIISINSHFLFIFHSLSWYFFSCLSSLVHYSGLFWEGCNIFLLFSKAFLLTSLFSKSLNSSRMYIILRIFFFRFFIMTHIFIIAMRSKGRLSYSIIFNSMITMKVISILILYETIISFLVHLLTPKYFFWLLILLVIIVCSFLEMARWTSLYIDKSFNSLYWSLFTTLVTFFLNTSTSCRLIIILMHINFLVKWLMSITVSIILKSLSKNFQSILIRIEMRSFIIPEETLVLKD